MSKPTLDPPQLKCSFCNFIGNQTRFNQHVAKSVKCSIFYKQAHVGHLNIGDQGEYDTRMIQTTTRRVSTHPLATAAEMAPAEADLPDEDYGLPAFDDEDAEDEKSTLWVTTNSLSPSQCNRNGRANGAVGGGVIEMTALLGANRYRLHPDELSLASVENFDNPLHLRNIGRNGFFQNVDEVAAAEMGQQQHFEGDTVTPFSK